MSKLEQIELGTNIEASNIRTFIENMSENIYEILWENKENYKDDLENILNSLERVWLPVDINLSDVNSSKYITISSSKEEWVFASIHNVKSFLLYRDINTTAPSLKNILSANDEVTNNAVNYFFSNILENVRKELSTLNIDEQRLIFNYLFFRLANIKEYYDILKGVVDLAQKIWINLWDKNEKILFLEDFLEFFAIECYDALNWGKRGSLSSNLKETSIKKSLGKFEKNYNTKIIKLEKKSKIIYKKLTNIRIILSFIAKENLSSWIETEIYTFQKIWLYSSCLPMPLLWKKLEETLKKIDFWKNDKTIRKLFSIIEKLLININQCNFSFIINSSFLLKNPQKVKKVMKIWQIFEWKQLESLSKAIEKLIELEKLINAYLIENHNISFHELIYQDYKISNEKNYHIANINKYLENAHIKEGKKDLVSYYLWLNNEKKELILKIIQKKKFIIEDYFDLIKYLFNKNINIKTKEILFMKLSPNNIKKSSRILFSCVENEKLEFLSTIYVHYWEKTSQFSIEKIRKIKDLQDSFENYKISVRIGDIIDNISKSEVFISNLWFLESVLKNKKYLFENEISEVQKINLDLTYYLDYINGEWQENIKKTSNILQQFLSFIENRKKLWLNIISHENFLYIAEELWEQKLYNINSEIIDFIINLDKVNINFMIYLLINFGITKTNQLKINQLETILKNKDEIEIIDGKEIGNYIYNIINENSPEKIENEQEKMIFKILELCENGNKYLDLDIDIDHLYTKSKRWLYLCIDILKKIHNLNKTEVVSMLILFDYNQLKNILKVYKILDNFDKKFEFYQLFIYDNLWKEQFIDEKMFEILISKIEKLSYKKIIANNDFIQDLINFFTLKKDINFLLKKYWKDQEKEDIFNINTGWNIRTEVIIDKIIKWDLNNVRLKWIIKSQPKIIKAIKQIKDLDFSGLDIKKMIVKTGFYRLKIDDIRIIFRLYKWKIYFIKIWNRENFYNNLNL